MKLVKFYINILLVYFQMFQNFIALLIGVRTYKRGTVNRGTVKRGQLIAGQLIARTHNRSDN